MSQSSVIAGSLLTAFIVFVIVRGELPCYLQVLGIVTASGCPKGAVSSNGLNSGGGTTTTTTTTGNGLLGTLVGDGINLGIGLGTGGILSGITGISEGFGNILTGGILGGIGI